jgi:hypothetical protein
MLPKSTRLCCSLYVDDAGIFVNPDHTELQNLRQLLSIFTNCSGLKFNLAKTEMFPIRCQSATVSSLIHLFPGRISTFPGKYLGLPLDTRKLRQIEVHPLIDKIDARLAGWKGKLLSKAGRETLVKIVLSSQPIYHLTVFPPQKWVIQSIDRIRRSFLWKGDGPENLSGGHCLIKWQVTARPKSLGGLGILDLERFARALRLRWMWYSWKNEDRAWMGLDIPCDKTDEDLFHASTVVTVGNGNKALFWKSSWISGRAPCHIASSLFKKTRHKNITVNRGLEKNRWISNIWPIQEGTEIQELMALWEAINDVERDVANEDQILWR